MTARLETESGTVYVDVGRGVAIQHVLFQKENVQGCECGHPNCTGLCNWGADVPPEVVDGGDYYMIKGKVVSEDEFLEALYPSRLPAAPSSDE